MTMPIPEAQSPTRALKSGAGLLRTPNLSVGSAEDKRAEIASYFTNTFDTYTRLFDCLAGDSGYFQKSIPLRHPLIFYLGHTATFFVNKLVLAKLLPERIDPQMESIFAVGVDEMSWDDLDEDHYDWPTVAEVLDYRAKVRATVLDLIETLPLSLPINWENPWWPIVMGVEHERIHLETSSVLIRQHDLAKVRPQPEWEPIRETGEAPENELCTVPAGTVSIGKPYDDAFYGWDNEYGEHEAHVDEFRASQYLVSNQEFLEFVEAGGYQEDRFWSEEGCAWRQFAKAKHPTFWRWQNGWHLRLMTEEVEMPWDWPVEVNYHEAKAFCEWKREKTGQPIRLPTEDEWYRPQRVREATESLYTQLQDAGFDVLFDDRKERPGVMFADMELIGIPHRIVVGEKGLDAGTLEYKGRLDTDKTEITLDSLIDFMKEKISI